MRLPLPPKLVPATQENGSEPSDRVVMSIKNSKGNVKARVTSEMQFQIWPSLLCVLHRRHACSDPTPEARKTWPRSRKVLPFWTQKQGHQAIYASQDLAHKQRFAQGL